MFSGLVVINYSPVFDSDIWKNTAERLALYSFSGGVFSFYNIVFFTSVKKFVIRNIHIFCLEYYAAIQ